MLVIIDPVYTPSDKCGIARVVLAITLPSILLLGILPLTASWLNINKNASRSELVLDAFSCASFLRNRGIIAL
jgi:hypothetical protein